MSQKIPENNYAFIDSSNLHLAVQSENWKVDYKKLRLYLKNKYSVSNALILIGRRPDQQGLYTSLKSAGFQLIFKQTVPYSDGGVQKYKGNVDTEMVLYAAAIKFKEYDKAIIITNDGDFACLVKFLKNNQKFKRLITPSRKYSSLLRPFSSYITPLEAIKGHIEYKTKNTGISGRSKP